MTTDGESSPSPAQQLPDLLYSYDLSGNRTFMERSDEGRHRYQYDSTDQLVRADFPDGGYQQFTYDPVGNRLRLEEKETDPAASSPPPIHLTNYDYNDADELLRLSRNFREGPDVPVLFAGPGAPNSPTAFVTSFSYDGNGSRVTKVVDEKPAPTAYTWDARQRMTSVVTGPETFTAGYDPFHQRVRVMEGKNERNTLADGGMISNRLLAAIEDSGKNATIRRELWLGGQRIGAVAVSRLTLYHADALGSTIAQSDSSGILRRTFFKPFGESRSTIGGTASSFRLGFIGTQGVQHDPTSGLDYMWYRYFEPSSGAYLSVDPISIRNLVRYAYAGNSPALFTDSEGLHCPGGLCHTSPAVDPNGGPEHTHASPTSYDIIPVSESSEDKAAREKNEESQKVGGEDIVGHGLLHACWEVIKAVIELLEVL